MFVLLISQNVTWLHEKHDYCSVLPAPTIASVLYFSAAIWLLSSLSDKNHDHDHELCYKDRLNWQDTTVVLWTYTTQCASHFQLNHKQWSLVFTTVWHQHSLYVIKTHTEHVHLWNIHAHVSKQCGTGTYTLVCDTSLVFVWWQHMKNYHVKTCAPVRQWKMWRRSYSNTMANMDWGIVDEVKCVCNLCSRWQQKPSHKSR